MAQMVTGLFPDRETAEHAMRRLEALGFETTRLNAEDYDRPDYYTNQMPQGATLISVDAGGRADAALRVMRETGGREVGTVARGDADMPTAFTGDVAGSIPIPDDERQALAEKAQDSRAVWHKERCGD